MSKLRISVRIGSFFAALLVATSVLALIPTPAGAVQTPESVVVNPDPADWTPDILDGAGQRHPADGEQGHRGRHVHRRSAGTASR